MTTITIQGKAVNGADEFAQKVEETLKRSPARIIRTINLDQAVEGLTRLREEWEETAELEEKSLIDIAASVGLLLVDVVEVLGLKEEDAARVLGDELKGDAARRLGDEPTGE